LVSAVAAAPLLVFSSLNIQAAEFGHHEEHHEAEKQGRHSDFKAQFHFVCKQPGKLAQLDVMLLSKFSGTEHVEVQLLTVSKQTALTLTAADNKISF
jgi:hypothetical protein